MSYTLGQAAKATGKAKSTILRAIKKGLIKDTRDHNNNYALLEAEVHTLWPLLRSNGSKTVSTKQNETLNKTSELEVEVKMLREMLEVANGNTKKAEEREVEWREQAKSIALMLPKPSVEVENKPKGWFRRLVG
ncbi:MAG: hypothetical protein JKY08_07700 [Flavobacteriaceae bacterium]|nr:hypothetical protein [Flavobacteriaceae bacterium]